jgi:hypothetical protein
MRDTRTVLLWIGTIVSVIGFVFGLFLALRSVLHANGTAPRGAVGSTTITPSPTATSSVGNQEQSPTPQPVTVVLPSSIAVVLSNGGTGGSDWLGPVSGVIVALSAVAGVALQMGLRSPDRMSKERRQIAQLAVWRDQGILSDEEFTAKKAELLAKIGLDTRAAGRSVSGSVDTTGP